MLLRVKIGLVGCLDITLGVLRELSLDDAKVVWDRIKDSQYAPPDVKKHAQVNSLYRQAGAAFCSSLG